MNASECQEAIANLLINSRRLLTFNYKFICNSERNRLRSDYGDARITKSIVRLTRNTKRIYPYIHCRLLSVLPSDKVFRRMMFSDLDILRVAHLMMHEFGGDAELEAANCIDRMRGHGDWNALLTWTRIQRTIALLDLTKTPSGLPN